MARIPQYQSSPAASSAVGVPPQDRSGQIIGAGVENLANTATNILVERQDKADSLAAMAKFGDYDVAYETVKGKAKQQFLKTPNEYPKAVREQALSLVDQFSKDLTPSQSRKFRSIVTNKIAQDAGGLADWANAQDQENILGDIKTGYYNLAINSEAITSPEGIQEQLVNLDKHSVMARNFISESSDILLKDQARKDIVRSAMTGSMLNDASKTYGDLVRGKYSKILTPVEEKTYLASAKEMMVNQAILGNYRALASSAVEVSTMADEVLAGTASPADIARKLDWAKLNKDRKDVNGQPLISENYIRSLESLSDMALGMRPVVAKDLANAEAAFATDFNGKWDKFWLRKKRLETKDYDDVIGLYSDLVDAHQKGVIDTERFNTLKFSMDAKVSTMIGKKKVAGVLTTSLEKAGQYGWLPWDNPRDVFSEGYQVINSELDKRKDLSALERNRFRENYLAEYTKEVKAIPENILETIKDPRRFAIDRIKGAGNDPGLINRLSVYSHPITGDPIRIGDTIDYQGTKVTFLGINPDTGKLRIATPKNFTKGLER